MVIIIMTVIILHKIQIIPEYTSKMKKNNKNYSYLITLSTFASDLKNVCHLMMIRLWFLPCKRPAAER